MRKITFLFLTLFASLSYGQTCNQQFEVEGPDDAPTVLTVNASDLTCATGTVNSITITDAVLDDYWAYIFGDTYCGEYYSFELNIDGVTSTVCADDLVGMDISNFTTLTITSIDLDEYPDEVWMALLITVDYTATEAPECTTVTGPITETEISINGVLEWDEVAGAAGYIVSVGTTSGGTDILSMFDAGDETTYDLPGTLDGGVEYFVNVTPYNTIGQATGCTEYNFTVPVPPTGSTCADPILVDALPYSATDDTANYFDTIYEGVPGGCGTTSPYLSGNDVVYAYTAAADTSITITLTPTASWSGIFVYENCADIGVNCVAGVSNSGTAPRVIPEFTVQNGQTYYIVISTYADPQTTAYTLDIIENTCISASATYTVVSDCDSGTEQFFVDVEITDLGSATSLAINDDQSSPVQVVSATGVYQFGPYPNGTPVIFTVENEQDSNCVLTSPVRNQIACPAENDDCDNAIELTVNADLTCAVVTAGNTIGATASSQTDDVLGTPNNDVWFNFVATNTVHKISLSNITVVSGTSTDMAMGVYNGSNGCASLTLVDDSDPNSFDVTGLTIGDTYYVRVYGYYEEISSNTFDICVGTLPPPPPAPANDECVNAIALTAGGVFADNEVVATNAGATRNAADHDPTTVASTCDTLNFSTTGKDVWFNVVAPDSGTLTIETASNADAGMTDTGLYVYRGASCDALTYQSCSADIGGGNNFSKVVLSNLTPGETITARVFGYSGTSGSFKISAYDASLSNRDFDFTSLKAYPNPVKDVLNLSYVENISQVSIFNLLGQQVLDKNLDATEAKIDMSNLPQGTYLVKVNVANQIKTLKVLKQ